MHNQYITNTRPVSALAAVVLLTLAAVEAQDIVQVDIGEGSKETFYSFSPIDHLFYNLKTNYYDITINA